MTAIVMAAITTLPEVHDKDVSWRDLAANRILDPDHPVLEALGVLYEHYFSEPRFRQHYSSLLVDCSDDFLRLVLLDHKPKIVIQKAGFPVGRYGGHRRAHFPDTILLNGFVSSVSCIPSFAMFTLCHLTAR